MEDFKLKKVKTKLGINISAVIPMVEEITKAGLTPFCLIGVDINPKNKIIKTHFATISDNLDPMLFELCKQLSEKGEVLNNEQNPDNKIKNQINE